MPTSANRGGFKTTLWVVLAACVITNVWYRGPFFGLVLLVVVAPPILLLTWVLRYARTPRKVVVPVGVLAAVATSWVACAPPTTSQLFERYLGCSLPDDISDLKRYDDYWGIDPFHCLRFHASRASVESIIAGVPLERIESPSTTGCLFTLLDVRDWWRPGDIQKPQVWEGAAGEWHVEMWYDDDSGLVYLRVYTM